MSEHFDRAVSRALRLGTEGWTPGNGRIHVRTASGSLYMVDNAGQVDGGSLTEPAKLHGAVYRHGGPIRIHQVLVGLRMELLRPRVPTDLDPRVNYVIITTPVTAIWDA